jgi:flagellar protein FlgJ
MLRPDFAAVEVAKTLAQESASIGLPLSSRAASGGAASFDRFFNTVRTEIESFISNGAESSAPRTLPSLSAEGFAHAMRLQADDSGASKEQQQTFVESVRPFAQQIASRLGIAPELVTAHAALESGWGQRPLRSEDGAETHNLFGIKASKDWSGQVAQALTTEFEDAVAVKRSERFRSYGDVGAAFTDYAQLLMSNPRFKAALNIGGDAAAFAQALARGGYATDPAYAQKIESVVRQVRELGVRSAGAR